MNDAELDRVRGLGDPAADALLCELGDVSTINALLSRVIENDDPLPAATPAPLRAFLEEGSVLPAWLHTPTVRRAHAWADAHLVSIVTALFCAALPAMYAAREGTLVLEATQRMSHDVDRRINETGRFVMDVVSPGSLGARGRAVRSSQKVRLVHAAVRRHLRARGAAGVPINQEEMLGVLFGFSVVTMRAVRRLEGDSDREGERAYWQLWRAIGSLLGVAPELVPVDLEAAEALSDRIADRQLGPSPQGRALLDALLAGMRRRLPHPSLHGIPERLVAELADPRARDALGLRPPPALPAGIGVRALARNLAGGPARGALVAASRSIARPLFEAWMRHELRGAAPTFRMPPPELDRWDLSAV